MAAVRCSLSSVPFPQPHHRSHLSHRQISVSFPRRPISQRCYGIGGGGNFGGGGFGGGGGGEGGDDRRPPFTYRGTVYNFVELGKNKTKLFIPSTMPTPMPPLSLLPLFSNFSLTTYFKQIGVIALVDGILEWKTGCFSHIVSWILKDEVVSVAGKKGKKAKGTKIA